MLQGFFFALGACFVWGMIFVIPDMLSNFSSVEIVLGRYFVYGVFSAIILFRNGFSFAKNYNWRSWGTAFLFALAANIFYYFGAVAGLRFSSAAVTVLIIGLAPIMIILYGNWAVREISYKQLVIPCICIATGMVLVNISEIAWETDVQSVRGYSVGLFGACVALIGWSLYVVHNARFLKKNPHVSPSEWATVVGVATLVLVVIIGAVMSYGLGIIDLTRYLHPNREMLYFYLGVFVLGIVCSWLGCFLWNRASSYLPVSLMGPFLIFETIFGLLFVYSVQLHLPSILEAIGILVMLGGIGLAIYAFRKSQFTHN